MLAKEGPALFRDLPENFKVGHPLPSRPVAAVCDRRTTHGNLKIRRARLVSPKSDEGGSDAPHLRFVHGCELLPV
jgi:hypothetical protein